MWAAAEEGGGGGRGSREEGEVMSEMAGLHNFSVREHKRKRGKMESKKGGGVLLVLEEVRLGNRLFFFSFSVLYFPTG